MLSRNDTPFAAIGFGDLHRDGMTMAVVAARATYDLAADGILRLGGKQEIAFSDIYEGDPQKTPLVQATDLIAYKPAADVTVIGTAYAPHGRPSVSWLSSVEIGAHVAAIRVHGPRQWQPTIRRLKPTWKLGAPEPVASVPLDYRLASGGRFAGDPNGDCDPRNPIGPGLLHVDWSPRGLPLRAPQIDSTAAPVGEPFAMPEPQGLGPVPPWWLWRQGRCGTYDERWQRERHPQPPADFDYRFFQTAHPSLVVPRLAGNEQVRLAGLTPGGGTLTFALPGVALVAHHIWLDGARLGRASGSTGCISTFVRRGRRGASISPGAAGSPPVRPIEVPSSRPCLSPRPRACQARVSTGWRRRHDPDRRGHGHRQGGGAQSDLGRPGRRHHAGAAARGLARDPGWAHRLGAARRLPDAARRGDGAGALQDLGLSAGGDEHRRQRAADDASLSCKGLDHPALLRRRGRHRRRHQVRHAQRRMHAEDVVADGALGEPKRCARQRRMVDEPQEHLGRARLQEGHEPVRYAGLAAGRRQTILGAICRPLTCRGGGRPGGCRRRGRADGGARRHGARTGFVRCVTE